MTAVSYHDTVNDLQGYGLSGNGPFCRIHWFQLLENAGFGTLYAAASADGECACLPLLRDGAKLVPLTNWYAFTWQPLLSAGAGDALLQSLAREIALQVQRIDLAKLPDEDGTATRLEHAFRSSGWWVNREICDTNHYLPVDGRSCAEYIAYRPGPLRTTLKRKAKKVQVRLTQSFDAADWSAYEDIYRQSWKPKEGDPALLRRFAESESTLGHYRFGMALADGKPVAAQFWTVEGGKAYIHKLAHLPEGEALSPGTTLTAALMEQVIDRDHVTEVDFGTGDDRYKADWMEQTRPRWRLTCMRPLAPRNWPAIGKQMIRKLVSPHSAG